MKWVVIKVVSMNLYVSGYFVFELLLFSVFTGFYSLSCYNCADGFQIFIYLLHNKHFLKIITFCFF